MILTDFVNKNLINNFLILHSLFTIVDGKCFDKICQQMAFIIKSLILRPYQTKSA